MIFLISLRMLPIPVLFRLIFNPNVLSKINQGSLCVAPETPLLPLIVSKAANPDVCVFSTVCNVNVASTTQGLLLKVQP